VQAEFEKEDEKRNQEAQVMRQTIRELERTVSYLKLKPASQNNVYCQQNIQHQQ
jgi:hypothetical protein